MAIATCLQCRKLTGDIDWHATAVHTPAAGRLHAQALAMINGGLQAQSDAMLNRLRPREIELLLRMQLESGTPAADIRDRADAAIERIQQRAQAKRGTE